MRNIGIVVAFALIFLVTVSAKNPGPDEIELLNGKKLSGIVVVWNGTQLIFSSDEKGLLYLNITEIKSVHQGPHLPVQSSLEGSEHDLISRT